MINEKKINNQIIPRGYAIVGPNEYYEFLDKIIKKKHKEANKIFDTIKKIRTEFNIPRDIHVIKLNLE